MPELTDTPECDVPGAGAWENETAGSATPGGSVELVRSGETPVLALCMEAWAVGGAPGADMEAGGGGGAT